MSIFNQLIVSVEGEGEISVDIHRLAAVAIGGKTYPFPPMEQTIGKD